MDWRKITDNPTDEEVSVRISKHLISIRDKIKDNDYLSFIRDKVSGKSVLDIGVVDHILDRIRSDKRKHKIICDSSKYCLGTDILEDNVCYLSDNWFNVKTINAISNIDLGEKFDVIHVRHLIEHVDKPIDLLNFCHGHINDDGVILTLTPNPFYILFFLEVIFYKNSNIKFRTCLLDYSHASPRVGK